MAMTKLSAFLLSLCLALCGCKSKPVPKPTGPATLIGIIEMVNPEQNYVLIRCEPVPSIQPGTELIALSPSGEKAKLVLSPERKGYYFTADIKEGHPEVQHLVLLPRAAAQSTDPLNPVSPAPSPPPPSPTPNPSSGYQPLPSLPDFQLPLAPAGSSPESPPTAPAAKPQEPPARGFDGLEPPVGGPSL